jgi:hypothetical protein
VVIVTVVLAVAAGQAVTVAVTVWVPSLAYPWVAGDQLVLTSPSPQSRMTAHRGPALEHPPFNVTVPQGP